VAGNPLHASRRAADRQALRALQAALEEADRLAREYGDAVDLLLAASMLSEGYHRVNYGRWRSKRCGR
jgi:hypothetical protein